MSLVINPFRLVPFDIHNIIQQFLSTKDCVSMCKVSSCTNAIWKNFIDNTPDKRIYILRLILNRPINRPFKHGAMLIKRLMCQHIFLDLAPLIGSECYIFLGSFLGRVLFYMTDVSHLRQILVILKNFEEGGCWTSRKIYHHYDIIIKHIKTVATSCWKLDVLVDVLNWLSTQEIPFEPDLITMLFANAVDRNDFILVYALIKNPKLSINSSYNDKTVLERLMEHNFLPSRKDDYFHIFACVIDHPDFDWESNKWELLRFINTSFFKDQLIHNFMNESERFEKYFEYTKLANTSNDIHYHVTLLNPSKKQKVV